ncbi:hypothetical protein D3C73_918900 [compost metagenome]
MRGGKAQMVPECPVYKAALMHVRDTCHPFLEVDVPALTTTHEETLTEYKDGDMVSRIRRTLNVEECAAAFEHINKIAQEAADEERLQREEKSAKLRALRLAAAGGTSSE